MEESLFRMIAKCSAFILILPTILALWRIKNGDREQRILSLLIFVSVFFELAALVMGSVFHKNNLVLLHIFTVIEFGLLAYLFKTTIQDILNEKTMHFFIVGFAIFAVINSLYFENVKSFNAMARAIEGVLIIFFILVYFYLMLKTLKIQHLERSPLFWIAAGTLLYFSGSLFIFIFSNHIVSSQEASLTIWAIHAILNIVLNVFYTLALWVRPKL